MSIFAITAPSSNEKIAPAIDAAFPGQNIKAWQGHWFISAVGTAKEIYDKIESNSPDKKPGTMIVVSVANYWGVANPDVWEWLKSRLESK
jgi:hypothetical protein